MTTATPQLPFDRPNLLELAPLYEELRREAPIARVTTPAGDPAWLVTRFVEVRDLLGDKRLGRTHPEPERAARITHAAIQNGPSGNHATEEADHTRMRRLLTPAFSAKRMRNLSDHVQGLVDGYLDRLEAEHASAPDGAVDLHAGLAFPLPVAVICRLLGVPEEDGEHFHRLSDRMATHSPDGDALRARAEFHEYMNGLADAKRAHPDEDVITDLVRAEAADADFEPATMTSLAVGLLFAGPETTVNRSGVGTLLLLSHREHWDELVADPQGRVDATVEEIMRMGAPGGMGLLRYAHTDVEVGGVTIERGEAVILSVNAANRDPEAFDDAEEFAPGRPEKLHLGFGHGAHFCIGASLARVELRTVFATLAERLPGLRLATDLDHLDVRTDHLTGGVRALPVTW
jgi:cytochrome P450